MEYAVIMAGGSGQRLWPLSRRSQPKQIINLYQKQSLLRHCVQRIENMFDPDRILVVTNAEYAHVVAEHLPELPEENILGEPVGRDTANAIGLAAAVLARRDPEAVMAVFSADQIIEPAEVLQQAVRKALTFLENNPQALFTFGIKASHAHTGFGYLKRGSECEAPDEGIYPVLAFREKPNRATARRYISSGNYCWNGGMFVWRVDTIQNHIERYLPHNAARLERIATAGGTDQWLELLRSEFPQLEAISIDYAVMERAKEVFMCELDCHWVDVGSFPALAEALGTADDDQNIAASETPCEWLDSRGNIAISSSADHLIATIGVEDLTIVHTDDATLVMRSGESDSIRTLLESLETPKLKRFL